TGEHQQLPYGNARLGQQHPHRGADRVTGVRCAESGSDRGCLLPLRVTAGRRDRGGQDVTNEFTDTMSPVLIAACWTSAGAAAPLREDETSPYPLAQRITAIAETGWNGIGLVHADLIHARDTIGYAQLSKMIREAGIGIVEV